MLGKMDGRPERLAGKPASRINLLARRQGDHPHVRTQRLNFPDDCRRHAGQALKVFAAGVDGGPVLNKIAHPGCLRVDPSQVGGVTGH
jgi:hypothetical protein